MSAIIDRVRRDLTAQGGIRPNVERRLDWILSRPGAPELLEALYSRCPRLGVLLHRIAMLNGPDPDRIHAIGREVAKGSQRCAELLHVRAQILEELWPAWEEFARLEVLERSGASGIEIAAAQLRWFFGTGSQLLRLQPALDDNDAALAQWKESVHYSLAITLGGVDACTEQMLLDPVVVRELAARSQRSASGLLFEAREWEALQQSMRPHRRGAAPDVVRDLLLREADAVGVSDPELVRLLLLFEVTPPRGRSRAREPEYDRGVRWREVIRKHRARRK